MPGLRSKLGVQTQWDSGEALLYNRLVLPFAVMGINVVKSDWWRQLALDNPGVYRIYRHHPNSDNLGFTKWMDDPEGAALDFMAFLLGHLSGTLDYIDLIAGDNEFILGPDHESPDRIDKADRFMAAFVQDVDLHLGKGVCVGNFNVGHWGPETVDYFPHTLAAIQAQAVRGERLSYLCFHEYDWPFLRDDTHWYTGKFLRAMPPILERYPDVKCMITEVGIDKASKVWGEHAGWRKAHDDIGTAIDMYCSDQGLAWYNDLLNQTDYVAAALIFGCGMGDWRAVGFDIMNSPDDVAIVNRIKQFPVVAPPEPPPPEPPDGGNGMKVKVVNMEYNEQTEEWAKAKYSIDWERAVVAEGEPVWRLVELWEKPGTTSHITQALDPLGNPKSNVIVTFRWKTAEESDIAGPNDWWSNYVYGPTNENGDVGPGMGTGAYRGEGDPCVDDGPHQVWIHDDDVKSDLLKCICMLAGTFHHHLDCKFKLMVGGEEPEPPDPDPPTPPGDPGEAMQILTNMELEVARLRIIMAEWDAQAEALADLI